MLWGGSDSKGSCQGQLCLVFPAQFPALWQHSVPWSTGTARGVGVIYPNNNSSEQRLAEMVQNLLQGEKIPCPRFHRSCRGKLVPVLLPVPLFGDDPSF